jgi:AcrR family transcriptional regulator
MDASAPSTRDRIVSAAFELFLAHGYDGTGLNQILEASGLSKGGFYHHFSTKEEVYREVVENFFLKPMLAFDFSAVENQPLKDSRDLLAAAYEQLPEAVSAAGVDMARYFALFFESLSRLDDFRAQVRDYYAHLLNALAKRAYEEHEIFEKVADAHARNMIGALEGKLFLKAVLSDPIKKAG